MRKIYSVNVFFLNKISERESSENGIKFFDSPEKAIEYVENNYKELIDKYGGCWVNDLTLKYLKEYDWSTPRNRAYFVDYDGDDLFILDVYIDVWEHKLE